LGLPGERISHHSGLSEIITGLALGFPFKNGGSVVLMEGEYPSDVLPWMVNEKRRGYKIVKLPEACFRDPAKLKERLPADTRVLNITHVMFNTGRRSNLKEIGAICRERGIFFALDVSQSFGGMPLRRDEIEGCDLIACVTYK
jgi:selenocysteine lyase/cysteine desulfurase